MEKKHVFFFFRVKFCMHLLLMQKSMYKFQNIYAIFTAPLWGVDIQKTTKHFVIKTLFTAIFYIRQYFWVNRILRTWQKSPYSYWQAYLGEISYQTKETQNNAIILVVFIFINVYIKKKWQTYNIGFNFLKHIWWQKRIDFHKTIKIHY